MQQKFITVSFNRAKIALRCADILYAIMSDDHCTIHMFDGSVYRCRITLKELKKQLDEGFMKVKRGCMIAVSAISDIGDKILLSNGEEICYTKRKKKALREELQKKQELMIAKISKKKLPLTPEAYGKYYKICDSLPFAFTDIEMVFNEEKKAVDWIFQYGNEALATLEKLPLDKMIGNSFSSLFSNMDANAIGVDCRYVHANAKASNPSHQWNQVKGGGKWYILDAQSNGFLLGTDTWIKQAGMSWDTKGLPTCSKTDYKR